ncbi:MAG: GyrI-like domain-containing protein [Gemmatimonadota bacterium]
MAVTAKLDLFKKYRAEYVTPKKPVLVKVGPVKYLAFTGRGAPTSAGFQTAIGALYAVAFTIKMTRKFAGKGDYKVAWLEGLWWGPDRKRPFSVKSPKDWRWKLLIRTPTFVAPRDLARAEKALLAKGKVAEIRKVKLETIREGRCVQMLHVGSYDKETVTLQAMHDLATAQGLEFRGVHHEIYLSDPRRVVPSKLRTILRHPVR